MEQETYQEQETDIEIVNFNSINFNCNYSLIIANLETSSNTVLSMVSYKVDTGSDGNIMPLYIYKKVFPRETIEQLAAGQNTNIKL